MPFLSDDAVPALSIDDVATVEGNTGTSSFVFTVSLSRPSAAAVMIDYATADGTAAAPVPPWPRCANASESVAVQVPVSGS